MQDSLLQNPETQQFKNHNKPENSGQELEGTGVRVVPAGPGAGRQVVAPTLQSQGFSLGKLIYDPKKGSCRTGQTVSKY